MMDGWGVLIGVLGAVAGLGGILFPFLKSRGENKVAIANSKTVLDAQIDARVALQLTEAWARQDAQELEIKELTIKLGTVEEEVRSATIRESRRTTAFTHVLRDIARQWPSGVAGPNLNPSDISEIEETIPASWIRPKTSTT